MFSVNMHTSHTRIILKVVNACCFQIIVLMLLNLSVLYDFQIVEYYALQLLQTKFEYDTYQ